MQPDFLDRLYEEVKQLFPVGTLQTNVARAQIVNFDDPPPQVNPSVQVVHKPTGNSVACSDFASQAENFVAATILLRIKCDASHTKSQPS